MDMIKNELEFYTKFARPLIFALPDAADRALAAAWVKKIEDTTTGSEQLRTKYIKLLLFALQRRKLVGIFSEDPSNYEKLNEFPEEYDLNQMAKQLIEKENNERIQNIQDQLTGQGDDFPPYTTDCSPDLREYVAAQDIPGFGVHCYYAISKYPVTTWRKSDKLVIPKMAKSAVDATGPFPHGFVDRRSAVSLEKDVSGISEDIEKKKRKKRKWGQTPPVKPLGSLPRTSEDRRIPTWSSNLLNVVQTPLRVSTSSTQPTAPVSTQERQIHFQEEDADVDEELTDIENAIEDFQRGDIRVKKRKVTKPGGIPIVETELYEYDQSDVLDDYDSFLDLNESQFNEDVNRDALLVKYIKDTVDTKSIEKDIRKTKDSKLGSIPAEAGIPVTTPRPSVSPKRQPSSERLYKKAAPSLKVAEDELFESTIESPDKDPEFSKLFLEATAVEDVFDISEPEGFDFDDELDEDEEPETEGKEIREPMPPPTKGSPAANAMVSEIIPALKKAAETEKAPQPFQTPPRFPIAQQPELPLDQEMLFIDSVFRDRDTAEMLKRVAHLVADVEQDFPDPVNLLFPDLPMDDVGPMPFLEEETMDFPPSPERLPSPPRAPSPRAKSPSPPRPPAPGIQPPSAGLRPPTSGIRPPSSGLRPPSAGLRPPSAGLRPPTSGVRPPAAVSQPQMRQPVPQPQQFQEPRTPPRPTRPMYFPSRTEQWPSPDENLAERLRQHQIDERFYDPRRPAMRKRVVVGRTAGKHKPIQSKFVPKIASEYPIREVQDERYPLDISFGTPERPAAFATDDTMFEFARGYVPPVYQSPPGIFQESPPRLIDEDDQLYIPPGYESRPGLVQESQPQFVGEDLRRAPGPYGLPGLRKWQSAQQDETDRVLRSIRRNLDQSQMAQVQQDQQGQPSRSPPRRRPPIKPRRLDFDDTGLDTDTYLSRVMERHPDLPDLPPSEQIPQRVLTPPRAGLSDWQSPERPFRHMAADSQMLDSMTAPFDDIDFSPPREGRFFAQPQEEDFYSGPSQDFQRTEVEMSPRSNEYFQRFAGTDGFQQDADFFDTDIDEMDFPMSPIGSPADRMDWRPPRSPEMSPGMRRFQAMGARAPMGPLPFETPPRRARPVFQRQLPPEADDFGLPALAQYSPLSITTMPEYRPRHISEYKAALQQQRQQRPCCSYHQKHHHHH